MKKLVYIAENSDSIEDGQRPNCRLKISIIIISTLLDRIAHVRITTAHARRSGRSAKLEINKPSTSKLVRSLDEKFIYLFIIY